MSNFDFISDRSFRLLLEADYAELVKCYDSEAWKSVQVLSGSIIEAMLIDYVASGQAKSKPPKDPLKMDLSEAILFCKQEKALSERSADLCSVIRSYRNLIHPGRIVRLGEASPEKSTASVAKALIDIVVDELSKTRLSTMGLSADQLISKISRDPKAIGIIRHLLAEMSEQERVRFLLEAAPSHHSDLVANSDWDTQTELNRLRHVVDLLKATVSKEIRERLSKKFINIVKQEDGDNVTHYAEIFIDYTDIDFAPEEQKQMLQDLLFSCLPRYHDECTLAQLNGIQNYLNIENIQDWIDSLIKSCLSTKCDDDVKLKVKAHLSNVDFLVNTKLSQAIDRRINDWHKHFEEQGNEDKLNIIGDMKQDIEIQRIF